MFERGCPTCKSTADPEIVGLFNMFQAKCKTCGSQTQFFDTIVQVELAWNSNHVIERKVYTLDEYKQMCWKNGIVPDLDEKGA